ncbi:MAG TPA: hypothetical protein VFL90_05400 [Methylomirabilota bacterium]|nr:hypothetical protein [Methylomirabilota bacterium]
MRELERALAEVPPTRRPTVVYAHGCRGIDDDARQWGETIAGAGDAMFAPDSLASGDRAPACGAAAPYARADLPRLAARERELRYALQQLLTLRWIDPERIVLLGFDHGAVVAAGWREPREFAGFILTGWSCTSPDVRRGLATPPDLPVLALRWTDDPRLRDPAWNGDCQVHLGARPGSRSVLLEGSGHSVAPSAEARAAVLRFLQARSFP